MKKSPMPSPLTLAAIMLLAALVIIKTGNMLYDTTGL